MQQDTSEQMSKTEFEAVEPKDTWKKKELLPQSQEKWSLSLHQCSETGMTKIKGMEKFNKKQN